jgi:hypothetical protein
MSNAITEQVENLTHSHSEETARVAKKVITTLAIQYENIRQELIKARKQEREATRKNRELQAQLEDAHSRQSRTETHLEKRVCTICLDSGVNMILPPGYCFCNLCLKALVDS